MTLNSPDDSKNIGKLRKSSSRSRYSEFCGERRKDGVQLLDDDGDLT